MPCKCNSFLCNKKVCLYNIVSHNMPVFTSPLSEYKYVTFKQALKMNKRTQPTAIISRVLSQTLRISAFLSCIRSIRYAGASGKKWLRMWCWFYHWHEELRIAPGKYPQHVRVQPFLMVHVLNKELYIHIQLLMKRNIHFFY